MIENPEVGATYWYLNPAYYYIPIRPYLHTWQLEDAFVIACVDLYPTELLAYRTYAARVEGYCVDIPESRRPPLPVVPAPVVPAVIRHRRVQTNASIDQGDA